MAEGENQPVPQATAPQALPKAPALPQIRTFQGDVASALSNQNESLVSISRAEHAQNPLYAPAPKSNSLTYLLVGLVLVVVAGVAGLFSYNEYIKQVAPPTLSVPQGRFISAESSKTINISSLARDQVFEKIDEGLLDTKTGELRHLIISNTVGTSTKQSSVSYFLQAVNSAAPGSLVRAFAPEFMFGALGQSRFLILKLASFPNAFTGMLNWEADMPSDLSPLFTNGKLLPLTNVFKDMVWKNKDVRILTEPDAATLLYSFFDNQYLIITDELTTLDTLIERLTREKLSR